MPLDRAWALNELRSFVFATEEIIETDYSDDFSFVGTTQREPDDRVAQRAQVVEQILDRVVPRWRAGKIPTARGEGRWAELREWSSRASAELERAEELSEKLGDGSPQMSVGSLHPWVWDAARSLWSGGHFRAAVHAAATSVVSQTQGKSGRLDISDKVLFQEVLGLGAPTSGRPRLRVVAEDDSQTYRSAQEGAMHVGMGLSQAVRNVAAHGSDELDQQVAAEQLAALSLLARWIDRAALATEHGL